MIIETALISALAPAAIDAVKTLFGGLSRRIGGLSVDDEVKLASSDISRLEALAKLDNPAGTPSQWVVDLRASFRYIASGVMVVGGIALVWYGLSIASKELSEAGVSIALAPSSFILGERMLLKFKK